MGTEPAGPEPHFPDSGLLHLEPDLGPSVTHRGQPGAWRATGAGRHETEGPDNGCLFLDQQKLAGLPTPLWTGSVCCQTSQGLGLRPGTPAGDFCRGWVSRPSGPSWRRAIKTCPWGWRGCDPPGQAGREKRVAHSRPHLEVLAVLPLLASLASPGSLSVPVWEERSEV